MKRLLALFLMFGSLSYAQTNAGGSASIGGIATVNVIASAPQIAGLSLSPSASTIVATWNTISPSSSSFACGTTLGGPYTITAVDNGTQTAVVNHHGIVSGLIASTTYYCQASSTNTVSTQTAVGQSSTTAITATTPITGVTYGAFASVNSLGCTMKGDTFYNAHTLSGANYVTVDDTTTNTCGTISGNSNMQIDHMTGTFPSPVAPTNILSAYGVQAQLMPPDSLSPKLSGMFAMENKLFVTVGRQLNGSSPAYVPPNPYVQSHGELMWSPDNGLTWNNWQHPTTFTATGALTTVGMFGDYPANPSNFASASFVMYCGDDGTLGYLQSCNRHDNGDAFIFLVSTETNWNNGSNYYLARVPRAKIANLNPSDYQFFKGGDDNLASNWSTSQTDAVPIITSAGKVSFPNIQYIPSLNRYIMLGFYYPDFSSGSTSHTAWLTWESPHPGGPWTLVGNQDWPANGWYNPVILNNGGTFGTTPYIMFAGDFAASGQPNYNLNYSILTIQH